MLLEIKIGSFYRIIVLVIYMIGHTEDYNGKRKNAANNRNDYYG